MVNYIPFSEEFTGADASGSDGDSNRTITLSQSTAVLQGMNVIVSGTSLHEGAGNDYTFSSGVVTFLNALYDDQNIDINYFYPDPSVSTTQTQYATTLQVFDFLRWTLQFPNYPTSTTLETVDSSGTLASGSKIYLDNKWVIDDTFIISFGATADSVTVLTETTDYTIDLDISCITITAAGATKIGSNNVYAEYKYNNFVPNSLISDLINRISKDIEDDTYRKFGTTTQNLKEEHAGKGRFKRVYRPDNLAVIAAKTQLSSAIDNTSTTLTVDDTTGFTAGDYIVIDTEVLLIGSVDSSTQLTVSRGQFGTTAAAHSIDDWTINVVVEQSNTRKGSVPTYNLMRFRRDYDVDDQTGAIQLLFINSVDRDDIFEDIYPPQGIFNRLRITYRSGSTSVPVDVTQATILRVAYQLTLSGIARALPEGRDGFNPTAQQALLDEYEKLIQGVRLLKANGF